MEEFEIKFLEVDVPMLEKKLLAIGAEKVAEYNYIRTLWDYPDMRMNKVDAWVKLRTDGKETTLSYKQSIKGESVGKDIGMKEIEVIVDDYVKTHELLKAIGLVTKREEKNKRIRYKKGNAVFDIDFWPFIPPYLEVEATSIKEAEDAAAELGFDPKEGLISGPGVVYKKYGFDIHDYSSITFEGMTKI